MRRNSSPQLLFPTDAPLEPENMIGRETDLETLVASLEAGINQIVGGPRRTGKTTLCAAAVARLREQGAYSVSVDLFGVESLDELSERIVDQAVRNRPVVARAFGKARLAGDMARERFRLTPVLRLGHEIGQDIELAVSLGGRDRASQERRFGAALTVAGKLASKDDRRLILYLDEAQELGRKGALGDPDRLTKRMRSVLQAHPSVTTLFSGSQEHLLQDLFAPRERAFFGWASWVRIGPIASDDWIVGLRSRFEGCSISVEQSALERLVETGEGQPRVTMLLAQHAFKNLLIEGTGLLDHAIVDAALRDAMSADYAFHEQILVELREQGRHAPRVAMALARGDAPYEAASEGVAPASIQRTLRRLEQSGLVEQRGEKSRGGWMVVDPLLRRYLAH